VLLYHFTEPALWEQILADGGLDPGCAIWTDGPKVLHLSKSPHVGALPRSHWGLTVRMTLDVDDASVHSWGQWSAKNLDPVTTANLNDCALHGGDSREWWVSEHPIESGRWISVERCSWAPIWPTPAEG
jgi:hypothetical protein